MDWNFCEVTQVKRIGPKNQRRRKADFCIFLCHCLKTKMRSPNIKAGLASGLSIPVARYFAERPRKSAIVGFPSQKPELTILVWL